MFKRIVLTLLIILIPLMVSAEMPSPRGFVTDAAGIIDQGTRERLEGLLSSFESQTGIEVAVVTVPSLDGRTIEDYSVDLFQKWGIGKKGKDNGALFIVAPEEKKMRIEVGYGLEGAINDALAGRILDEAVVPRFKEGNMSDGIAAGTVLIVSEIVKKEGLTFDVDSASKGLADSARVAGAADEGGPLATVFKIILLIIAAIVFIRHPWLFLFFLSMSGGRGGLGGRGFGGGFGGFGGGLSGGGGASRSW
jgi:uncharacterized protein